MRERREAKNKVYKTMRWQTITYHSINAKDIETPSNFVYSNILQIETFPWNKTSDEIDYNCRLQLYERKLSRKGEIKVGLI